MDKIKIINPADSTDFFEIPWEWLERGTYAPTLNDLEASAERGKLNGSLNRVRCAEVPAATLSKKPNPPDYQITKDNNTDNIIYNEFIIEFSGYKDIKL